MQKQENNPPKRTLGSIILPEMRKLRLRERTIFLSLMILVLKSYTIFYQSCSKFIK
jgi:hypothetical protein